MCEPLMGACRHIADHDTDELVQKTLGTEFSDTTLIVVAHRLQSVMNADKIMVLDAGNLVEYDSPSNLLKSRDGHFSKLVDASGEAETLRKLLSSLS